MSKQSLTVNQVAKALGKSADTIREWIASGTCPFGYVKDGKRRNFFIPKPLFEEKTGIIIKEDEQ